MDVEAVVFDFDGTLATQRGGWLLLHELYGTRGSNDARTEAYRAGEITFAEWCERTVADWVTLGVTTEDVERAAQAVKLTPGAEGLLAWLDDEGLPFGVISAGVTDLQRRLDPYDPAFQLGNDLTFVDGRLSGAEANVGPDDKDEVLAAACDDLGADLAETVYVGDSHTDVEAFEVAGHSILFDPDGRLPDCAFDLVDGVVEEPHLDGVRAQIADLH